MSVKWIAFPLHPETPEEGRRLEELFGTDVEQKQARLRQVAAAEGLPYGDRKMTFNSRLAQELAKWAEENGQGDAFHDAVFRKYFVDGQNIARIEILVELSAALGLAAEKARQVLETRSYREAVDADWLRSRQMGVTAVPTFVCNGRRVVGAQPYEVLARLVAAD